MSTKTLRKRIALVAVSALGAGLLTVSTAHAANEAELVTSTKAASTGVVTAYAISSHSGTATITSGGSLALDANAGTAVSNVTVSGGTFVSLYSGGSVNGDLTKATSSSATALLGLVARPNSGVSSMIIKSYDGATSGTAVDTVVVTVVATTSVGVADQGESKSNLVAYNTTINSLTDSDITGVDTLGASVIRNGYVGQIAWQLRDANDVALSSSGTVTVASSSPGLLVSLDNSFFAQTVSGANTNSYGSVYFEQATANAPASGTVTLSYNGTPIWTKSVTVVGDIAKVRLTAVRSTGKTSVSGAITAAGTALDASGATATANAGAFTFAALDAAGNVIGGRTLTSDSGRYNASVSGVTLDNGGITTKYSATAALSGAGGIGETLGTWTCTSTAGSAKIRLKVTNAALVTVYSNELTAGCAGDPDSYTASFDKSSYVPGDIAVLTIKAKTSAGGNTYSGATVGTATTAEIAISGSNMTPVTAPANTDTFGDSSSKSYKFIVGSTEGSYNMVVDLPKYSVANGYSGVAQTVAYKISSGTASVTNAEVLAAIVKLIASINKQIAALQKALKK